MKIVSLHAFAAIVLLGIGFAGLPAAPAAAQHVCEADATRLCSQFIPDERRTASCLRLNRGALSPACRQAVAGGRKARRTVGRAHR